MAGEFEKHLMRSIDLLNNQVAGMQTTLATVEKSQEKLFAIVANGNGQPSLIAQTSSIQARVVDVEKDVNTLETKVSLIEKHAASCRASVEERLKTRGIPELTEENRLKRYGLWAAISSGVAAFFIKVGEWAMHSGGAQ